MVGQSLSRAIRRVSTAEKGIESGTELKQDATGAGTCDDCVGKDAMHHNLVAYPIMQD